MNDTEPPIIELAALPPLAPTTPGGPALMAANLQLVQGVKVGLAVMVGEIQTTLGQLMALQQQSILKIDRSVEAPVDVLLDGKVVARGQLVVVDDNFGVCVTEILSPT